MIENQQVYVSYIADGEQREWEFPYQFVDATDISLYIKHGDEFTKIEPSLFEFDPDTKKCTYPKDSEESPVPQGDTVLLTRETDITQLEDSSIANFKSTDVERIADKLTIIDQELKEELGRCIKYNQLDAIGADTDASDFFELFEEYADDAIDTHNTSSSAHADIRTSISNHVSDTSNPHSVTKSQVGLGDVDNTSDLNKPISTATQNALDLKQDNLTNSQLAAVNSGIDSEQVDQIGINTAAIASEIADREDADTLLQNQITALSNNKQDNLTSIQLEAVNSGINSTKVAAIATNTSDIAAINTKIPSEASSTNKLADKTYVNDAVNSVAAYYVTSNAQGESFATKAALVAGPWYYDGSLRTPTTNDYALVAADETHDDNAARYTYTGSQWAFQYIINTTTFTQDQLNAIDSGITATKVSSYDSHIINTSNPHSVTKSQVGLGNVDNTSDLSKPVSTATQSALNALDAAKASNADDSTIIDNGATISTVAVKEQRANAVIKKWVGTKAQYDAITTKDANTTYIVTDENDSGALVIDSALSSTSTNAVQNRVVYNALQGKQATLPAGTTGYFLQKTATGVQWAEVQAGGGAPTLTWYTGNTGTTVTIADTSGADLVKIYKNGILLEPTADYSISGTTLTLVTALVSTDKITVEVL